MPSFKFTDGTPEAPFEEFEPDATRTISLHLPSVSGKKNGYGMYAKVYISVADAADIERHKRAGQKPSEAKIRAGILACATKHPLPKGVYLPFQTQGWGGTIHRLDNLTGAFIFNEKVQQEK